LTEYTGKAGGTAPPPKKKAGKKKSYGSPLAAPAEPSGDIETLLDGIQVAQKLIRLIGKDNAAKLIDRL
jgi:hypothetical protein